MWHQTRFTDVYAPGSSYSVLGSPEVLRVQEQINFSPFSIEPTVDFHFETTVAAVPLPPAGWLGLGMLGLMGLWSGRRRQP